MGRTKETHVTIKLALVGGGEWTEGCVFDEQLVRDSGSDRVAIIPAAAAFEDRVGTVQRASDWFKRLGVEVDIIDVYRRSEALDPARSAALASSRFVYLAGGSPMHLRSVLKDTPCWDSVLKVFSSGGVLAGSAEGASVLCSHMVDSRGGAFTVGLGLLTNLTVIPRHNLWSEDKLHRTVQLAQRTLSVVGIDERTALCWDGSTWTTSGVGNVSVFRNGSRQSVETLEPPVIDLSLGSD